MRRCSICRRKGHNKRTCSKNKSNIPKKSNAICEKMNENINCIVCLENIKHKKCITTCCCNKNICGECYLKLLDFNCLDCPNCRSFFNSKHQYYSDKYVYSKILSIDNNIDTVSPEIVLQKNNEIIQLFKLVVEHKYKTILESIVLYVNILRSCLLKQVSLFTIIYKKPIDNNIIMFITFIESLVCNISDELFLFKPKPVIK